MDEGDGVDRVDIVDGGDGVDGGNGVKEKSWMASWFVRYRYLVIDMDVCV